MSGNMTVSETLTGLVFPNGTVSGSWVDTFNSAGTLIGVAGTLTASENGTITTFTNLTVVAGGGTITGGSSSNVQNYEIGSSTASGGNDTAITLMTPYGNEVPTSVDTATNIYTTYVTIFPGGSPFPFPHGQNTALSSSNAGQQTATSGGTIANLVTSGNETLAVTLSGAVFANGETVSGSWIETFNSAGILIGVSDGTVVAQGNGVSNTFTNLTVGAAGGTVTGYFGTKTVLNYGVNSSTATGTGPDTGIVLTTAYGNETPKQLFSGTDSTYTYNRAYNEIVEYTNLVVSGTNNRITNPGTLTYEAVCFFPGTQITTPAGERAVEALQPGDLVFTASGEKIVRWVGQNHVHLDFADPLRTLPVRIQAGALGNGLPRRDLLVSPAHALHIDGVMVQAGALVGLPGIARERNVPRSFTYYHVELDTHEWLLAEGMQAESFVDHVESVHFQNWEERQTPNLAIPEMALPRVKSSRQLPASLRQRLAGNRAA